MGAKIVDHGMKEIQRNIKIMAKATVKVGLIGGKADGHVIAYAGYNEFGTKHIPSRPFMRNTFDQDSAKMEKRIASAYVAVQNGSSVSSELTKTGLFYQGLIQKMIGSNIGPANKPKTIARKGSSKTLIDNGRMRQSISFEVK